MYFHTHDTVYQICGLHRVDLMSPLLWAQTLMCIFPISSVTQKWNAKWPQPQKDHS